MTDIITAIVAVTAGAFLPLFIHNAQWFLEHMESEKQKIQREQRVQKWQNARDKAQQKAKQDGVEFVFDKPKPEQRPFYARIPEDWVYMFTIVSVVGLFTMITQAPYLLTEAGRVNLSERGLLWLVIGMMIGFKGYMFPLGIVKFFQGMYRLWIHRQAMREGFWVEEPVTLPALSGALGQTAEISLSAKPDDL